MRRHYRVLALLLICSIISCGCWDQKIFEQTGLALSQGLEISPSGKLLVTYSYPVVGGKEKDAVAISSSEATVLRDAREHARLSSPKLMEAGKIQQILISDELAKTGIHDLLEVYQRDATNPAIAYIVIVEGSPKELLTKGQEFIAASRISFYLYQLLENNAKLATIPNTKVFDFDIDFFAPGLDPVTPIIKLKTDAIEITGSALFSKDKMVGKLDNDQSLILLGMMGLGRNTDYILVDPKLPSDNKYKYGLSVELRKPKRKISISFDEEGKPIINISLKYNCVLDEYQWNKTDDEKELLKLEKSLNEHLAETTNKTIKYMQSVNSDPIGFGNLIRAKYNTYWNSIKWEDVYKEAQISANVQVKIVKQGITK